MAFEQITGLWKDSYGKDHYNVKLRNDVEIPAGTKLFLFPNNKREGKNDPDFTMKIKVEDEARGEPEGPPPF